MSSIIKTQTKKGMHYKVVYDLPPTIDGKRKRTSKTFPIGTPLKCVKEFAAEKDMEHNIGTPQNYDYDISFDELATIYFNTYTEFLSPSTLKGYKAVYYNRKTHGLKNYFGNCKIRQITTLEIQKYINFLSTQVSPKSCKNYFQLLNVLFSLAVTQKIIQREANPMLGKFSKPKYNKKPVEAYTLEEVKTLLELAQTDNNGMIELILNLALLTGIRRGELAGLKWNKVNLDEGYISVDISRITVDKQEYIKSPKTSSGVRKIFIPETLIEILKKYRHKYLENQMKYGRDFKNCGFVVSKENGEPYSPQGITNCYVRFMERHSDKIRYLKFHGLRHTYASILIEQGENPKTVQHNLGHSDVALTLQIYSHTYESAQKNAANKLNETIKFESA